MIVTIDGRMITRFIEDSEKFEKYADERFRLIDQDHQGDQFPKSDALDSDDQDCDDRFSVVDLEKYRSELVAIMVAVAQGIGGTPVNVAVDEGSLLKKVYEIEIARIEEEEKKKMKEEKIELNENDKIEKNREEIIENGIRDEIGEEKKMRKKKRVKIFRLCACSSKYYGEK